MTSISSYSNERFGSIRSNYLYTYILAGENTSRIDLEEKLTTFVSKRLEPYYGDLLSQGLGIHEVLKIHLFPITDIHLHPSPNWEIGVGGSMASVYIFFSIAVLILIIACINFMNLSTASASKRAKEITLRKTIGANSNQLRVQFIQESLVLAILALIFALVLISFFIPAYNSIFNEELSTHTLFTFTNLIFLIGMTLLVGLLSGLYPAFYLTKFDPISTLKGGVQSGSGKSIFRRAMVVIQFAISITLIIGTLVAHQQMKYMQTKSLGFNKENVILIPVRSQRVAQNFQNYRNKLVNLAQIQSVSVSSDLPGENFYSNTNFLAKEQSNNPVSLIILATDFDFIDTYRMDLVTGRIFSKEISSDTSGTLMLNEAAINRFGWTAGEAIGKELSYSGQITGKIVGVVKDFNFRSLHTEIEPLALILNPNYFRSISVRIQPGNIQNTISLIQQKWESSFPGEVFEFSFLDNRMNQLYKNEMKMQNIFIIFSCFSVLIACLGLFGLSVFIAAERTKEIGIRKVLGASMSKIILLLSKEFITWVLIANIFAWPMAWFIMTKWLQNFAYKIELSWWIFGGAGVVALSIALLTVSVQAIKAATANPIESLKYE